MIPLEARFWLEALLLFVVFFVAPVALCVELIRINFPKKRHE
ncbi:hypothetical protein [Runella zeae]|nr:hypothetical protein [Runella zeae]